MRFHFGILTFNFNGVKINSIKCVSVTVSDFRNTLIFIGTMVLSKRLSKKLTFGRLGIS